MQFSKTYKVAPKTLLEVEIRLNDEHKNGHDDFSITGTIFVNGRYDTGGCIHDEILKADPSLQIFVDLHLHDSNGAAMHCLANAWFWLKSENKPQNVQKMLMLSDDELAALVAENHESADEFHVWIDEQGLPRRWKAKANEAIQMLEKLTGKSYVRTAGMRPHYKAPTPETILQVLERRKSGYYSDENKQRRAQDEAAKVKAEALAALESQRAKAIRNAQNEYLVKAYFVNRGYPAKKIGNIIYYNHTNVIAFNWATCYDKWTPEEFERVRAEFSQDELPEGVMLEYKA